MRNSKPLLCSLLVFCLAPLAAVLLTFPLAAQSDPQPYLRTNSFGILTAYSNDSSHILIGQAEQRRLFNFGFSYSRKLVANRIVNWQYDAEFLPLALESDPLSHVVVITTYPTPTTYIYNNQPPIITCHPAPTGFTFSQGGTIYSTIQSDSCMGRQWTLGESISPLGSQWNFLPRHRLQPVVDLHAGYMYSTHPIPIVSAGSFNFVFDLGAGFEFFRTHRQSMRVEFRYHHIPNDYTASQNPGIDNGLFHVAYVFGR